MVLLSYDGQHLLNLLAICLYLVLLYFLEWLLHVSKTETDLSVRLNIALVLLDWIAGNLCE